MPSMCDLADLDCGFVLGCGFEVSTNDGKFLIKALLRDYGGK